MMCRQPNGDRVIRFQDEDTALIVIDMQNKFYKVTEGLEISVNKHLNTMNSAIELFRSRGSPVIMVMFDGFNDGTNDDAENPDELVPGLSGSESDIIVHKRHMNSFLESDLEDAINRTGCKCIVLSGLVAQLCVLATYFRAFDLGFDPWILKGGIAATDENNVDRVEGITRVVTLDELRSC